MGGGGRGWVVIVVAVAVAVAVVVVVVVLVVIVVDVQHGVFWLGEGGLDGQCAEELLPGHRVPVSR